MGCFVEDECVHYRRLLEIQMTGCPVPRSANTLRLRASLVTAVLCAAIATTGAVSVFKQYRLTILAQEAISIDAHHSMVADKVATLAIHCRRFEKDVFLNIHNEPTRNQYMQEWHRGRGGKHLVLLPLPT
jgi:hypothetical protein